MKIVTEVMICRSNGFWVGTYKVEEFIIEIPDDTQDVDSLVMEEAHRVASEKYGSDPGVSYIGLYGYWDQEPDDGSFTIGIVGDDA